MFYPELGWAHGSLGHIWSWGLEFLSLLPVHIHWRRKSSKSDSAPTTDILRGMTPSIDNFGYANLDSCIGPCLDARTCIACLIKEKSHPEPRDQACSSNSRWLMWRDLRYSQVEHSALQLMHVSLLDCKEAQRGLSEATRTLLGGPKRPHGNIVGRPEASGRHLGGAQSIVSKSNLLASARQL